MENKIPIDKQIAATGDSNHIKRLSDYLQIIQEYESSANSNLILLIGFGIDSLAFLTSNNVIMKITRLDEQRKLESRMWGKRPFDSPFTNLAYSKFVNNKGEISEYMWYVQPFADPVSDEDASRIEDTVNRMDEYSVIDSGTRQWGNINGEVRLLDYDAVLCYVEQSQSTYTPVLVSNQEKLMLPSCFIIE